MLRRALALGVGLLILILIVLGVRGCLNARKDRALRDYAQDVTQIVEETNQTSESFFSKLSNPGKLSVTDFVDAVQTDRSAIDSFASRVDGLDAPGDMSEAQSHLELVYALRSSAMTEIAEKASTALGDAGAKKAIAVIENQVRKLAASDVLYGSVVRPEINGVLADRGLEGDDVPKSIFVPGGSQWIADGAVGSALRTISGSGGGDASGVHGLGLIRTSVNGTELSSEGSTNVSAEGAAEVEVEVQNQGESTETGVNVVVKVNGGNPLQQSIDSIEAGETATVTIPLTPVPSGEATLEVEAEPVAGEQVTDNNEATYPVVFE